MNLYEEIELQEKERTIDSLATENQMLQEPKTLTKEQIDYIRKQMDLLSTPLEDIPVIAIQIWEKIRNN